MMDDELLRKHFDFDEADLFTNRHGALTPKQQMRLAKNEQFMKRIFMIVGLVFLSVAVLPSLITWLGGAPWSFLIIWSVIWIPIWGFFGIKIIRLGISDKKDSTLQKVEGPINIVKEESYSDGTIHDYELHVSGETFDVDPELADIMMQGDLYAIYYIGDTKEIMSVEMLERGK